MNIIIMYIQFWNDPIGMTKVQYLQTSSGHVHIPHDPLYAIKIYIELDSDDTNRWQYNGTFHFYFWLIH